MAYTFKDDGSALTYYREYNKEVNDKNETLVGNWVEERALKEQIGTGRYQLWVTKGDEKSVPTQPQKTFTKFSTRPDALDTFSRTLAHSDVRTSPAQPTHALARRARWPHRANVPCAQFTPQSEYCTNNQVPDPGYAKYINPGTGAREKLLVERARRGRQRTRRPAAPAPALRGRPWAALASARSWACRR